MLKIKLSLCQRLRPKNTEYRIQKKEQRIQNTEYRIHTNRPKNTTNANYTRTGATDS